MFTKTYIYLILLDSKLNQNVKSSLIFIKLIGNTDLGIIQILSFESLGHAYIFSFFLVLVAFLNFTFPNLEIGPCTQSLSIRKKNFQNVNIRC